MLRSRLSKRRIFSAIESLETRRLLASVTLNSDGLLKIEKQTGDLTVTATADNQVQVQDGTTNHGVFNIVKGIEIKGTKTANNITVDAGSFTLGGTLKINSAEGDDVVSVKGSGGTIGGETSIQTESGDDDVELNTAGGALTFGSKLKINDNAGSDELQFGNASGAVTVNGPTEIVGYGLVNLGKGSNDFFIGDVSIGVDRAGSVLHVNQGLVGGTETAFIIGNLTIKGGSVDDTVFLRGMICTGDVKVDLGNAVTQNRIALSSSAATHTEINGSFEYKGGKRVDLVDLSSGIIHGNANIELKEGDDDVNLNEFSGPTIIEGNLKINAGAGNDTFAPILAQIGGNAELELGDGNHNVIFENGSSVGGILKFRSGNGTDSLTLRSAQTYLLDAKFGGGDDFLTLDNAFATLTGKADGESGVDTFTVISGTVDPSFQLVSFP